MAKAHNDSRLPAAKTEWPIFQYVLKWNQITGYWAEAEILIVILDRYLPTKRVEIREQSSRR